MEVPYRKYRQKTFSRLGPEHTEITMRNCKAKAEISCRKLGEGKENLLLNAATNTARASLHLLYRHVGACKTEETYRSRAAGHAKSISGGKIPRWRLTFLARPDCGTSSSSNNLLSAGCLYARHQTEPTRLQSASAPSSKGFPCNPGARNV